MEYIPINYETWDFGGQGKNIDTLLNREEKRIWETALPYQDKRGDVSHAETVAYFSIQLLKHIPEERRIVVPAAMLHDIGWSQLTETELKLFYDAAKTANGQEVWQRYESILRVRHQEEGVTLVDRILTEIKYPREFVPHILEIISQHDIRKGFYSLEDGIVRDADKLWRFTLKAVRIFTEERKWPLDKVDSWLDNWIKQDGFFYDNTSKKIAGLERDNTFKEYTKFKNQKNSLSLPHTKVCGL